VTSGPVYVVSNAGAKHYDLETDAKNVWTLNGATQVQKAADVTTYQVIDVAEDSLTYRSYIVEIDGDGLFYKNGVQVDAADYKPGDLWDEFTVHKTDHGQKAVVTAGTKSVTSVETALVDATGAITFTTNLPATAKVTSGEDLPLRVSAMADSSVTYQWQRLVGSSWVHLLGRTGSSLNLEEVRTPGTKYRVLATAGTRTATSSVTAVKVVKRDSRVRMLKSTLKAGQKPIIKLRGSVAGKATVKVSQGKKTWVKSVVITKGRTKTVRFSSALLRGGNSKATVSLVLNPTSRAAGDVSGWRRPGA
jgi:hypothetical protein